MAAQYRLCPYFIQSGCGATSMAGPAISPGRGLASNAAPQDQGVRSSAGLPVVARTPADLDKPKSSIERACRGVLGCDLKDDRAEAVVLGLGDDRIEERASDAPAAPLGQHPDRQNLDFAGEIARQDKADRAVFLPCQVAEPAGQREDPFERCRVPRAVGEAV